MERNKMNKWKKPKGVIHFKVRDVGENFYSCAHPLSQRSYLTSYREKMTHNPNKVTCKTCKHDIEIDRAHIKRILAGEKDYLSLGYYLQQRTFLDEIPIWAWNKLDFGLGCKGGYWCIMTDFYNLIEHTSPVIGKQSEHGKE
jgi:hypothetical protein